MGKLSPIRRRGANLDALLEAICDEKGNPDPTLVAELFQRVQAMLPYLPEDERTRICTKLQELAGNLHDPDPDLSSLAITY